MSWTLLSNVNPNPSPLFPSLTLGYTGKVQHSQLFPTSPGGHRWLSPVQCFRIWCRCPMCYLVTSMRVSPVQCCTFGVDIPVHVLLSNQHAALSCSVLRDLVWTSRPMCYLVTRSMGRIFISLRCRPQAEPQPCPLAGSFFTVISSHNHGVSSDSSLSLPQQSLQFSSDT